MKPGAGEVAEPRSFRAKPYECLGRRRDALFELADAILASGRRRRPSRVPPREAPQLLEATPVGVLAGEGEAAVPEAEEAGPASQNTPGVPAPPSSHHPFSQSNVERTKSSRRSASCPEDVVSEFAINGSLD